MLAIKSGLQRIWEFFLPIRVGHTVAIKSSGKIKAWEIRGEVLDIVTSDNAEKIYLISFEEEKWTEYFFRDEIVKVWSLF